MGRYSIKLLQNGRWNYHSLFDTWGEAQKYMVRHSFPKCDDVGIFEDDVLVDLHM